MEEKYLSLFLFEKNFTWVNSRGESCCGNLPTASDATCMELHSVRPSVRRDVDDILFWDITRCSVVTVFPDVSGQPIGSYLQRSRSPRSRPQGSRSLGWTS
jgi:hypothetical protein